MIVVGDKRSVGGVCQSGKFSIFRILYHGENVAMKLASISIFFGKYVVKA